MELFQMWVQKYTKNNGNNKRSPLQYQWKGGYILLKVS